MKLNYTKQNYGYSIIQITYSKKIMIIIYYRHDFFVNQN